MQIWFWEKFSMVHLFPSLHHTWTEKLLMQFWDQLIANAHNTISRQQHFGQGKVNNNAKSNGYCIKFAGN
jgi:hypothetical protein